MSKKRSTERLVYILIIAIGIIGGYFYYSSVSSSNISPVPKAELGKGLAKMEGVNFDFSVFDKIGFKELRIFGESPVRSDPGGKTNLFAPF